VSDETALYGVYALLSLLFSAKRGLENNNLCI
jgi:hypothetical protein